MIAHSVTLSLLRVESSVCHISSNDSTIDLPVNRLSVGNHKPFTVPKTATKPLVSNGLFLLTNDNQSKRHYRTRSKDCSHLSLIVEHFPFLQLGNYIISIHTMIKCFGFFICDAVSWGNPMKIRLVGISQRNTRFKQQCTYNPCLEPFFYIVQWLFLQRNCGSRLQLLGWQLGDSCLSFKDISRSTPWMPQLCLNHSMW